LLIYYTFIPQNISFYIIQCYEFCNQKIIYFAYMT